MYVASYSVTTFVKACYLRCMHICNTYMYIYKICMYIMCIYAYVRIYNFCISYNTGKSALPDIYMHNARGHTAPEGECVYIR